MQGDLDNENIGCDTTASDRQASSDRQVFCSSKILHPLLSLDLLHSRHAAQGTQDSEHNSPEVNIQGTSLRDTVSQCGMEMSGAAVSMGTAGVRGAEADCGRDCYTWRLVCESDGKRLPPQA